jgi:Domain of Unknown Function (DUF1259)
MRTPMFRSSLAFPTALILLAACGPLATDPQTKPSNAFAQDSPDWWRLVTAPLHGRQIVSDDSFAVIVPRDDLDLESEMGQIPISAGISSRFYFFRCHCGKVKVLGEFVVCDFESDAVLDAIRAGKFTVVSLSPILQNTRPSMLSIHFQAEGDPDPIVQTLRSALDQTAHRRSATQPDVSP